MDFGRRTAVVHLAIRPTAWRIGGACSSLAHEVIPQSRTRWPYPMPWKNAQRSCRLNERDLIAKGAAEKQPLPEGCITAFIRVQHFIIWNIDLRGITAMDSFFCRPIGEPVVLN